MCVRASVRAVLVAACDTFRAAAVEQFRGEMASFVTARADQFPTMAALDDGSALMGFVKQYREQTGRWVEPEEAAPLFEKQLEGSTT